MTPSCPTLRSADLPDACLFSDLGHGHRRHPVLDRQPRSRVEDRLTHRAPVLVDRLTPQLRHLPSIRSDINLDIPSLMNTYCIERSEEHTSELQSLMRISYAVFCFKKKNNPM